MIFIAILLMLGFVFIALLLGYAISNTDDQPPESYEYPTRYKEEKVREEILLSMAKKNYKLNKKERIK